MSSVVSFRDDLLCFVNILGFNGNGFHKRFLDFHLKGFVLFLAVDLQVVMARNIDFSVLNTTEKVVFLTSRSLVEILVRVRKFARIGISFLAKSKLGINGNSLLDCKKSTLRAL